MARSRPTGRAGGDPACAAHAPTRPTSSLPLYYPISIGTGINVRINIAMAIQAIIR